jgi:hypothetical protein
MDDIKVENHGKGEVKEVKIISICERREIKILI